MQPSDWILYTNSIQPCAEYAPSKPRNSLWLSLYIQNLARGKHRLVHLTNNKHMLSLYYLLDTPLGDDVAMDKVKKNLCFHIFQ